jgi:hypothetical protein
LRRRTGRGADPRSITLRSGRLDEALEAPTLLVLGSEEHDSALVGTERAFVANALRRGTPEVFDAGHGVDRDDFEGYVRLLGDWLGGPAHRHPG